MRIPTFQFRGAPVYFDGLSTGSTSFALVTQQLVSNLRERHNIPAFALGYDKSAEELHRGRHLTGTPPAYDLMAMPEYIYVDAGISLQPQLALWAEQSIVITAIDDFRWKFPHIRHAWDKADSILSFSKFSCEALSKQLKRKVGYFPLGVSIDDFHYVENPTLPKVKVHYKNFSEFPEELPYTFLTVGFMQGRKGIGELLSAYYSAFYGSPEVLLWIHGRSGDWADPECREYLRGFSDPNAPMVVWSDCELTAAELCQLYNSADCYVCTSHLEGFGLGPLQAMSCGLPVISTTFSGMADYLTPKNATLIPTKGTTIKHPKLGVIPWGAFSSEDLISALRTCPEHKNIEGMATARKWSWAGATSTFLRHLEQPGQMSNGTLEDPPVTICIPCLQAASDLGTLLDSLLYIHAGCRFHVIVGNDGNDPKVAAVCDQHKVSSISTEASHGVNELRNKLIAHTHTAYIVFLDCDTKITTHNWLRDWLAAHKRCGAAASTILQFFPDGTVNSSGHNIVGLACPKYKSKPAVECYSPRKIAFTQTSAAMFTTEIIRRYGFWEEYTLYYDEADACKYLRENGHSCWYLPVTSLIHVSGSTRRATGQPDPTDGRELYKSFWKDGPELAL